MSNLLVAVAVWLHDVKQGTYARYAGHTLDVQRSGRTACMESIEVDRQAGTTRLTDPSFEYFGGKLDDTKQWAITLGQAEGICREAAFYNNVVLKDLALFQELDRADNIEKLLPMIEVCDAKVDELVAAKIEPTFPYPVGSTTATVADLKPKICNAAKAKARKRSAR